MPQRRDRPARDRVRAPRAGTPSRPEARLLGAAFARSSVLAPFCPGAAAGAIASGRVPVGNAAGDPWASWLNPASLLIGVLAVLLSAFLEAVFLAADADRAGLLDGLISGRTLIRVVLSALAGLARLALYRMAVTVRLSGRSETS